jgi:hypothetical protein
VLKNRDKDTTNTNPFVAITVLSRERIPRMRERERKGEKA